MLKTKLLSAKNCALVCMDRTSSNMDEVENTDCVSKKKANWDALTIKVLNTTNTELHRVNEAMDLTAEGRLEGFTRITSCNASVMMHHSIISGRQEFTTKPRNQSSCAGCIRPLNTYNRVRILQAELTRSEARMTWITQETRQQHKKDVDWLVVDPRDMLFMIANG
jgi:hypothetical protein